jgi:hypothetical protein
LATFISISSFLEFWPTIIPSYTLVPGVIKVTPRPCALVSPKATAMPASDAISTPFLTFGIY